MPPCTLFSRILATFFFFFFNYLDVLIVYTVRSDDRTVYACIYSYVQAGVRPIATHHSNTNYKFKRFILGYGSCRSYVRLWACTVLLVCICKSGEHLSVARHPSNVCNVFDIKVLYICYSFDSFEARNFIFQSFISLLLIFRF